MSNKVLEYIIRATDQTKGAVKSAASNASTLARDIGRNLMNIQAGFQMATGIIGSVSKRMWSAVKESFKFETLTTQFSVLMGSLSKAKERMKELADFADRTPFQMAEVANASRMLHVFSNGAMGAVSSLKLVGDAAAAVGQPFQEVALWVGRAYSMIKGGQPFGEAAMRLQEMGLITPDVRRKMEDLQAAGASNIAVWSELEKHLGTFSGGMDQLSKTGGGLMSTLADTWTAAVREFGNAFAGAAKDGIKSLSDKLQELKDTGEITTWAEASVKAINKVSAAGSGVKRFAESNPVGVSIRNLWANTTGAAVYAGARLLGGKNDKDATTMQAAWVAKMGTGYARNAATRKLGVDINAPGFKEYSDELGIAKKAGKPQEEIDRLTAEMMARFGVGENKEKAIAKLGYTPEEDTAGSISRKAEANKNRLIALNTAKKADEDRAREASRKANPQIKTARELEAETIEKKRIAEDMARAQALTDSKLAEENAKKEAAERDRLSKKQAEDDHTRRLENIREEAQLSEQSEAIARDRLSRANSAAQQAWGWYKDPTSFRQQLTEEKTDKAAEKQYEKDFDRLNNRSDWRTTTRVTDSDEAVRRVALAREEQDRAEMALTSIAANTAKLIGLESMLRNLLTSR